MDRRGTSYGDRNQILKEPAGHAKPNYHPRVQRAKISIQSPKGFDGHHTLAPLCRTMKKTENHSKADQRLGFGMNESEGQNSELLLH